MNRLTRILSLYLLALALWPCADGALSLVGPERGQVVSATAAPAPGSSCEQHDQCTPLCTCTCCAVAATVAPRFSYALILPAETTLVSVAAFAYAPIHWADSLSAIWQPPKLS